MAWAGELWRSSPAPMPAAAPHASAEATRNLRSGMCAFISFLLGLEGSGGCKKFKIVRCCREAASAQEVTRKIVQSIFVDDCIDPTLAFGAGITHRRPGSRSHIPFDWQRPRLTSCH